MAAAASASTGSSKTLPAKKDAKPAPSAMTVPETLTYHLELIQRSIASNDPALMARVLRYANHVRKHVRVAEMRPFVASQIGAGEAAAAASTILDAVEAVEPALPAAPTKESSGTASVAASSASGSSSSAAAAAGGESESKEGEDEAGAAGKAKEAAPGSKSGTKRKPVELTPVSAPERAMYVGLVVAGLAVKQGMWAAAEAQASRLVDAAVGLNRRTMDALAGRALSLLGLASEKLGRLPSLQSRLMSLHRTAALRHDGTGQAVAINLVLRGLLSQKRFLQAGRLIDSVESLLPLDSSAQLVRFLLAKGRVLAVAGDYPDADACLTQALRKAPGATATGFKQLVQKHSIVVHLLRGIIPERVVFQGGASADVAGSTDKRMAAALHPYLLLTQAVRSGDVEGFSAAVEAHRERFARDDTLSLVQRLRRTVIRSGLTKITRAYSAITFADVAAQLGLRSAQDAESLCAKAISDGVIRAQLDHDNGCMVASAADDTYATSKPKEEFHKRIDFSLEMHAEAVRAMRYPPGAFRKDEAALLEARQREDEEAAVAKAIEESDFMGGDDDEEEDEDEADM